MIDNLNKWHETRISLFVLTLVELAITYGFASLSIDRGNLLWYALALIFLVATLRSLFKFLATFWQKGRAR